MKLLTFKLVLSTISLAMASLTFGQSQQHVWYLKNQEIDFTTASPTVLTGPAYGAGGDSPFGGVGNGVHDAFGNKIMSVFDAYIDNASGSLGILENWEFGAFIPEIVPKPGSSCSYYIIYSATNPMIDNPWDEIEHYCANSTGYFNSFYMEVDMSANFGDGAVVGSAVTLQACNSGIPNPSTVTQALFSGNRYLYIVGNDYTDGLGIDKYLITSSGITFQSTIYESTSLNSFEPLELDVSQDMTMLAMASSDGDEAMLFHLDASGNLDATVGNNADGTSTFIIPSTSDILTGVEFSPNSQYLYVGSKGDGIRSVQLSTGNVSSILAGSTDFGNSQLELAYDPLFDYKIMAVASTGSATEYMGAIVNPNSVGATFNPTFIPGVTVFDEAHATSPINKFKNLPSQIDGEDYIARFNDATGDCCAALEGFDVAEYTVTTNATWSPGPGNNPFGGLSEVRVAEELRIPAGRKITMNNMIFRFNEGAKLVIEPGARLITNGTTLTSMSCEGLMWKGVELQGDYSVDQTPFSQQGRFVMKSNSEISNAHNGVSVYGRNLTGGVSWAKTGGIIQASNSTFRNNTRDVEFLSYMFKNYSSFSNCQFITDDEIKDGGHPPAHVSMYHVRDVRFSGCDFENTTIGLYPDTDRGYGIKSIEAKYHVGYRCNVILPFGTPCPDADKDGCRFENLFYGIEATGTPFYTINIEYNDFINNTQGVYLGGMEYSQVVNNGFVVPSNAAIGYAYGLYLDDCTAYQVENNDFSTAFSTQTYGAIVNNSNAGGESPDINEIYHNYFNGFDYSLSSILENVRIDPVTSNPVVGTGLTFKCNTFQNSNRFDILALWGGVSPFQGACTPEVSNPDPQANNQFSYDASIGDFWNANPPNYGINYIYEPGGQREPRDLFINMWNTTKSTCGVYDANSCPENRFDLTTGELDSYISYAKSNVAATESQMAQTQPGSPQMQSLIIDKSYWEKEQYLHTDELIRVLLNDTTNVNEDTVEVVLANSTRIIDSKQRLASLYVKREKYNEATSLITELRTMDYSMYNDFCVDLESRMVLNQSLEKNFVLESDQSLTIRVETLAAKNDNSRDCFHSKMLLKQVFNTQYNELIPVYQNSTNMMAHTIENSEIELTSISVHPNPSKDIITIELFNNDEELSKIQVYNLTGKEMKSLELNGKKYQVDLTGLSQGTYLLHIELSNGEFKNEKLIIQ